MNPFTASPFDLLTRLVTLLIALFGAASLCARRVAGMRGRARVSFARVAQRWMQRGYALA